MVFIGEFNSGCEFVGALVCVGGGVCVRREVVALVGAE